MPVVGCGWYNRDGTTGKYQVYLKVIKSQLYHSEDHVLVTPPQMMPTAVQVNQDSPGNFGTMAGMIVGMR